MLEAMRPVELYEEITVEYGPTFSNRTDRLPLRRRLLFPFVFTCRILLH